MGAAAAGARWGWVAALCVAFGSAGACDHGGDATAGLAADGGAADAGGSSVSSTEQQASFVAGYDAVLAAASAGACVDFMALRADADALRGLRRARVALAALVPELLPTRDAQLALWIDAHNFCVLDGLLQGLGTDLSYGPSSGGFGLFRTARCVVGGVPLSPDQIAHGVLRGDPAYGLTARHAHLSSGAGPDPRIHAALYLGSHSSPPLRAAPFSGGVVQQALDRQAARWVDDPRRGAGPEGISHLFVWFAQDFVALEGGVAAFIHRHRRPELAPVALDRTLPFVWDLDQADPALPACGGGSGDCVPAPERCDGLDEDCDGLVDEGLVPPAGVCPAEGVCAANVPRCAGALGWVCDPVADREDPERTCDGLDNDCDGLTDEELPASSAPCSRLGVCADAPPPRCLGVLGWECPPAPEFEIPEQRCDGLDNDCDGAVDNVVVAPEGVCLHFGVCGGVLPVCRTGVWECEYPATYEPGPETACDALDNDCDGVTDEEVPDCGCVNQERRDCGSSLGRCLPGIQFCWLGEWSDCSGLEPEPERCDGQDNDCDGLTDEGVPDCECAPWTRERCGPDLGRCYPGWRTCDEEGRWGPCEGGRQPEPEICDGWDNDCDGATDEIEDIPWPEDKECRQGGVCGGLAELQCRRGRWSCLYPEGYEPVERSCDGLDNDCDGLVDEDLMVPDVSALEVPAGWDDPLCWAEGDWEGPGGCCPPRFRVARCSAAGFVACCLFEICGDPEGRDDDCDGRSDDQQCR